MDIFEAKMIIGLQTIRSPFLDYLFYIITLIGSEYFFLALAAVIYWCVNKRYGYKFFSIFMVGQFFTGIIKVAVKRLRPHEIVTDNGSAQSVMEMTPGKSFPSGHSQNAANMTVQLAVATKSMGRKLFTRVVVIGSVVTLLVMFSRMYLGQHFFSDVVCGAFLGIIVAISFSDLFELLKTREEWLFLAVLPLTVILAVIFIGVGKNPEDVIKILGTFGAMSLGYYLEKKYVRYEVRSGVFFKQIIKVFSGILVLIILKDGIKLIGSSALLSGRPLILLDYVRYFLVGIFASFCMPAFFKLVKL